MGAAFPLSLGRRLNRGDPPRRIVVSILKRGLLLAFFAVALGNTGLWTLDAVLQRPVVSALVTMTVWGCLFRDVRADSRLHPAAERVAQRRRALRSSRSLWACTGGWASG